MCGRYYRKSDKQKIAERMRTANDVASLVMADADYNVAPTTFQPVIRETRDSTDRELVLMKWGLIPFFAKSLADFRGISTINARAETVANSGTFRKSFERRRCIVPASGFYEWRQLVKGEDGYGKNKNKQPYRFELANGNLLAFAGLWDAWKEPKKSPQAVDTWLQSFTIITTDPNELTAPVHNRMPVILAERDWDRWLSRAESDSARLPIDLLRPYPAEDMEAFKAHQDVGSVKNNSIELLNSA